VFVFFTPSTRQMKLQVNSRSGRKLADVEVTEKTSVAQLKNLFYIKCPKYGPERQRFTFGPAPGTPLVDGKTVADYSLKDGDALVFKDLGPQIGYATVFIAEYFGPLLLYPIFYFKGDVIYGEASKQDFVQQVALLCWSFHYIKRILETIFVHRFSHATMPIFNLAKNCSHYWGGAILVSYFVNHPSFTPPPLERVYFGLALFVVSELFNLICHLQLAALRPAGSKDRKIPRGLFFELVSCPNYLFEILAWTGFTILTQTLTAGLFTLLGAVQMWFWALTKHIRYRKDFNGKDGRPQYPRNRKVLVPFIL